MGTIYKVDREEGPDYGGLWAVYFSGVVPSRAELKETVTWVDDSWRDYGKIYCYYAKDITALVLKYGG